MLLLAFAIKAAVFPLSFWLPDSYPTAPAPVTAVFAGLLTKVGVYAIIRTETQLFVANDLNFLLMMVALSTMIVGILGAVAQAELKRILSFTLVSHIGYMIFGLAINTPLAVGATIYYIVHHIIVQTTLFLAVGLIERRAGSTSILKVKGLMRAAPCSRCCTSSRRSTSAVLPPFSGFIGKYPCSTRRRRWHPRDDGADRRRRRHLDPHALRPDARVEPVVLARRRRLRRDDGAHRLPRQRPGRDHLDRASHDAKIMTLATVGMVAVTVSLTVFAGPLLDMCLRAASTSPTGEPRADPGTGGSRMSPSRRSQVSLFLHQLPFLVWLVALWMLLWGQFTWLAFLTGLVMASSSRASSASPGRTLGSHQPLVRPRVRRHLPRRGHQGIAHRRVAGDRRPPSARRRIIAVPLRVDDDVIMAHTAVTASLIPGIAHRRRRPREPHLFLHTIGVRSDADAEHQRRVVLGWEARITRAVGSKEELQELRAKIAESDADALHGAETPPDGRTLL